MVLNGVLYALIIALLVLRRFRHLIIWLILTNLLALIERQGPDFTAVRFDVFPGGCATTRIRALASSKAEITARLPGSLASPRQQLAQALEQRSGGRLQLDP